MKGPDFILQSLSLLLFALCHQFISRLGNSTQTCCHYYSTVIYSRIWIMIPLHPLLVSAVHHNSFWVLAHYGHTPPSLLHNWYVLPPIRGCTLIKLLFILQHKIYHFLQEIAFVSDQRLDTFFILRINYLYPEQKYNGRQHAHPEMAHTLRMRSSSTACKIMPHTIRKTWMV